MNKTATELTAENTRLRQQNNTLETELQLTESKYKEKLASCKEAYEKKAEAYEKKVEAYEKKSADYDLVVQAFMASQRDRFGSKSERFVDESGQQMLFGSEEPDPGTDPEDIEEIKYTRKRPGKQKWDISHFPTREVIIRVSDEDRVCICGCKKEVIRYNETSRLNRIPAKMEVIIEKREVVACRKGCEGSPKSAPAPKRAIQKCKATESLLAYIAISKVLDRQPLYHLERKINREHHWLIGRSTMSRWMCQLSEKLQPLINLMQDQLIGYDIASIDATSLQVLREPGRPPEKKSNVYCIRGGPPGKEVTLFEYNAYSHRDYIADVFEAFQGTIHVDAHPEYDTGNKRSDITLSLCHAHARRNFEKIYKATKKKEGLSKKALQFFKKLYAIESEIRKKAPDERQSIRMAKSKPILDEFKIWLDEKKLETLPKTPVGKSISYCLNHWDGLNVYLSDGRLEIDNNATERQIRPFVIARKNLLFACTQKGADSLGVHFSLILTALNHGLEPQLYYKTVLEKIPFCNTISDYEELLPWNFKP